jgi:hypothetical protein
MSVQLIDGGIVRWKTGLLGLMVRVKAIYTLTVAFNKTPPELAGRYGKILDFVSTPDHRSRRHILITPLSSGQIAHDVCDLASVP